MELNGFEVFGLFLCSSIFGVLSSVWVTTKLVTDREILLVITLFAAVALTLLSQMSAGSAVRHYLSRDGLKIHDKQVADLNEGHRKRIASLKSEHQSLIHHLQASLNSGNAKFERLHYEHNWMSSMYQDQMRSTQEQEDRIAYLEIKLQEFGQHTSAMHAPFSAPPAQISFSHPPRRDRFDSAMNPPAPSSPLSQVVEAVEE